MSFSVGIVGLPNVGKSTLFKALTKIQVDIAAYPFTTVHPNIGVVQVPDERLEKIAEVIKPEKTTPTAIKFVDIAGLVKGAHQGEGLGNQFLARIRNCDAVLQVLRGFEEPGVENVLGEVNPEKEIEIINTELLMKDLETLEKLIQKIETDLKKDKKNLKKLELLKKIKNAVAQGKLIAGLNLTDDEKLEIKEYQFLTQKPTLYLLNTNLKDMPKYSPSSTEKFLELNLKEEAELSELSLKERAELGLSSRLDELIINCYDILELITFYTIAGFKEARAWTLKKGSRAQEAGLAVHSDFKEKFIKAEVVASPVLLKASSLSKAKELGSVKTVGKEYVVQDGDIIEFKI